MDIGKDEEIPKESREKILSENYASPEESEEQKEEREREQRILKIKEEIAMRELTECEHEARCAFGYKPRPPLFFRF